MVAQIIDGKSVASQVQEEVKAGVEKLKSQKGITPGLATILVGSDPASHIYVRNKRQACENLGIQSFHHNLPETLSEAELLACIEKLNKDETVHGILVQLPLPSQINPNKVLNTIDPRKDVDGFHPVNLGNLLAGTPSVIPCTPYGIMRLLESISYDFKGKKAVVVGRSNIVGKPMALLLMQEHATVTICHSRTTDLAAEIRRADLVVAALGKTEFIQPDWVQDGAVLIDVGMNRNSQNKLVGDIAQAAFKKSSYYTPVPGGVGPMTIAMLMANTLKAALQQTS